MQDYLKSLNPKRCEKVDLVFGQNYRLWRGGKYVGVATWTEDENVGDSFQNKVFDSATGKFMQQVYIADKWEIAN